MARVTGPQTVRDLLTAGYDILADEGLAKLTLDGVVARTNVTKGALIHHFRSKDELARRLMHDAIEQFDQLVDEIRGDDQSAGSYTRAYLKAAIASPRRGAQRRILAAIGELSRYRGLSLEFRKATRRWSQKIENDGLNPARAQIVRLAADGLWANDVSEQGVLSSETRRLVIDELLRLAQPSPR